MGTDSREGFDGNRSELRASVRHGHPWNIGRYDIKRSQKSRKQPVFQKRTRGGRWGDCHEEVGTKMVKVREFKNIRKGTQKPFAGRVRPNKRAQKITAGVTREAVKENSGM